ncbi:MAG: (2Fe-2S)-binding protein [Gammaproteobacteria bacterium]
MTVAIYIDDERFEVPAGTTLAAALYMAGQRVMRSTPRDKQPRSLFCGMGVCYDCMVVVDGRANVRACQTAVRSDMRVYIQKGEPRVEITE